MGKGGFWNGDLLLDALDVEGQDLITPVPESRAERQKRVACGAYELAVAREYFVTSASDEGKRVVEEGKLLVIPPGQLSLLITVETVRVPNYLMGFISVKFGKKKKGLVNISGFHVDPGFHGKLKFSVYNAGSTSVYLEPGEALFSIWFCTLAEPETRPYNGEHNFKSQSRINDRDVDEIAGNISSPGELKRLIDEDRSQHEQQISSIRVALGWHQIFLTVITSVIAAAIVVPQMKFLQAAEVMPPDAPVQVASQIAALQQRIWGQELITLFAAAAVVLALVIPPILRRLFGPCDPPMPHRDMLERLKQVQLDTRRALIERRVMWGLIVLLVLAVLLLSYGSILASVA